MGTGGYRVSTIEIIAEAAQGFEGIPKQAELLARAAVAADADAVKFQLVYADELATPDYRHYGLFRSLEMPDATWRSIIELVHEAGKRVYFDVLGVKSLGLAKELGADGVKLSTTEFYNQRLTELAFQTFDRLYLSIGGIPVEDIDTMMERTSGVDVCFMFGFQAEPTGLEKNNLLRLRSLQERCPGKKFGFMDHSLGTSEDALYLPLMTLGLGIACIEKHLTIEPILEIEDYVSALSAGRFKEFVRLVRKFESALGSASLTLTPDERSYRKKAVKVAVALEDLAPETGLTVENVGLKRVGERFAEARTIHELEHVLGKRLKKATGKDEPITEDAV
jgi:N,N'-diacetyllegionaminate synthase